MGNTTDKAIDLFSLKKNYDIEPWSKQDIHVIYTHIEKPHWAPWLSFSEKGMKEMYAVFPQGQLVVKDKDGLPLAYASTNRINWNGKIDTLPTWDEAAGGQVEQANYKNTYLSNGNTLIIMCLTVRSSHQGMYLSSILIDEIKILARKLKVKYIISPFRPSTYGLYKQEHKDPGFKAYCRMIREDGLPVDTWLRSLVRNGMKPLVIRENSLVVEVSIKKFYKFKSSYNPKCWQEISANAWECGEVGLWFLKGKKAVYKEPELFGKLSLH